MIQNPNLPQLLPLGSRDILAIDLETTGLDASDLSCHITTVGLADAGQAVAFDYRTLTDEDRRYLFDRLRERKLTAFNVMFDAAWLWREVNLLEGREIWDGRGWLNWECDTYALYFYVANEGFDNQKWSLESMQQDVLGWPDDGQKAWLKAALQRHGLTKDRMWELADREPEQFMRYCALDAEAHLQAYDELANQCRRLGDLGKGIVKWHKLYLLNETRWLIQQQLRGISIDTERLERYAETLRAKIREGHETLAALPAVAAANETLKQAYREQWAAAEPPQLTKTGKVSARWQAWAAKEHDYPTLNVDSPKQMAWLFFDVLGYEPAKLTETGAPAVSKDVLPLYGEVGTTLAKIKKLQKELQYVDACLAVTRDGVLHPMMKNVGTVTGRLSAGSQ